MKMKKLKKITTMMMMKLKKMMTMMMKKVKKMRIQKNGRKRRRRGGRIIVQVVEIKNKIILQIQQILIFILYCKIIII